MVDYNHPKLPSYLCCSILVLHFSTMFFFSLLINFLIKESYKFQLSNILLLNARVRCLGLLEDALTYTIFITKTKLRYALSETYKSIRSFIIF